MDDQPDKELSIDYTEHASSNGPGHFGLCRNIRCLPERLQRQAPQTAVSPA